VIYVTVVASLILIIFDCVFQEYPYILLTLLTSSNVSSLQSQKLYWN